MQEMQQRGAFEGGNNGLNVSSAAEAVDEDFLNAEAPGALNYEVCFFVLEVEKGWL